MLANSERNIDYEVSLTSPLVKAEEGACIGGGVDHPVLVVGVAHT